MRQLLGTHQNRLDAKGRVSVPAAFRSSLRQMASADEDAPALVLRPSHQYPCIDGWPGTLFEQLSNPLEKLELFSEAHDDLATALFGEAWPVEPDREGRIVLPESLALHANLGETVMFIGLGRFFQIWEPAAGQRRIAAARDRSQSRGTTLPGAS